MTNKEKAIEVLARCGHFGRVGAASFLDCLQPNEINQLASMHDDLAAADATAGQPLAPEFAPLRQKAAGVGERYRAWMDAVADRREQAKPKATAQPKAAN